MFVIYAPWNAFEPSTEAGSARTDADETAASAGEVEEASSGALVGVAEVLEHLEITKSTKRKDNTTETSPWFYLQKNFLWVCQAEFLQIEFFCFVLVLGSTESTCCESVGSSRTSAWLAKCLRLVEDGKRRTERTPPRGPFPGAGDGWWVLKNHGMVQTASWEI